MKVYLNLEPGNIIVCSGRSLGKTVQVKVANFETAQTVSKSGTQIKGTYNFDYAGRRGNAVCVERRNDLDILPYTIVTQPFGLWHFYKHEIQRTNFCVKFFRPSMQPTKY